ncbi:MAG: penicillin-binding protein 2 [Dehalococcoidia bacterium]|nr:penicillin-binding protein 2 [Dehalococcoidia bacterium]
MSFFSRSKRWKVRRTKKVSPEAVLRNKFLFFHGVIVLSFMILAAQLWRMQIVEGSRYLERADGNRIRRVTIPSNRGIVYDRNGAPLVQNVPSFAAAAVVGDIPITESEQVITLLASILSMQPSDVEQKIKSAQSEGRVYSPTIIKSNLNDRLAMILRERGSELPGVKVLVQPQRNYIGGNSLSHMMGYVGSISQEEYGELKDNGYDFNDTIGKTGLELSYEKELRGEPGWEEIEVNARGLPLDTLAVNKPKDGFNLHLSIDLPLQKEMSRLLQEGTAGSDYAAAMAMDPNTGQVLGMTSIPSYNNNVFTTARNDGAIESLLGDPHLPLLNYAVSGRHPPGSVFKVITGTAALQEGIARPSTTITSTGSITVPNQYDSRITYIFRDWAALGAMNFYRGLAMSSDVYFYYLAGGFNDFIGLGAARLAGYARAYGLDKLTGIDLPDEIAGLVPDPEWKEAALKEPWLLGDTYHLGIGQGYAAVTPVEMLVAVSAIANGGDIVQPQLASEISDAGGQAKQPFTPKVRGRLPISQENINHVIEGMRQAVETPGATATTAYTKGMSTAGKTGSAEFGEISKRTGQLETHAWFIGFAPLNDPKIAVVVFAQRGSGSVIAAPIGGKIIEYYLSEGK